MCSRLRRLSNFFISLYHAPAIRLGSIRRSCCSSVCPSVRLSVCPIPLAQNREFQNYGYCRTPIGNLTLEIEPIFQSGRMVIISKQNRPKTYVVNISKTKRDRPKINNKPLQYFCQSLPLSYLIDERRLLFFRKLLVHDNIVIKTLVALPAVYYEYIALCSKYDIKDPLSSRTYIKSHVFKAFCASVF